jgi:hypothetical protein
MVDFPAWPIDSTARSTSEKYKKDIGSRLQISLRSIWQHL